MRKGERMSDEVKSKISRSHIIRVRLSPLNYFNLRYKENIEGCWIWTGSTQRSSRERYYGSASYRIGPYQYREVMAHRLSWELHRGEIPYGINVCHTCDVTMCVNPDHLFLGTQRDNMRDMTEKGRRAVGSRVASCGYAGHHPSAESTAKRIASRKANGWNKRDR